MLGTVALSPRHVDDYAEVAGDAAVDELRRLAEPLRGLRLVDLSLSAFGTWAADLLGSAVPLLHDLGLNNAWFVARAEQQFEPHIRALYAAANGSGAWSSEARRALERFAAEAREALADAADVVVVHDPQLVSVAPEELLSRNGGGRRWIWHSHLDLSGATPTLTGELRGYADRYDALAFEDSAFLPPGWPVREITIVPPGIDPLGPRNVALDDETAAMLVAKVGINPGAPLVSQVSPLDPGSDALGLIEVFDALRPRFPSLQLAIVPTSVRDDEATRAYFESVSRSVKERPGCVLVPVPGDAGNAEVNAIQQRSTVVLQKSLRRGYALWLSEAMWKERPVVAGRTAGTVAQVMDGATGFLVPDTATCVERVGLLLSDGVLAERLGAAGRRHVRERFLITRYLSDVLRLVARVVGVR